MNLQLAGKVALVTGASQGIGRAIVETLAAEGMRVVLAARSRDKMEAVAATLPTPSLVQAVDLRQPQAPAAVVAAALTAFGQLDLVVNNAGATVRGDFLTLRDEDWYDGFALKFFGAMRCCRAAWPHLRATHGSIILIAGIGGRVGSADFTIGGSVNAALVNLTKALAARGTADGVRVNAINPGSIATERFLVRARRLADASDGDLDAATRNLAADLGVARIGEPVEIARTVAFLASPLAGYCHGAILDVDGGQNRAV